MYIALRVFKNHKLYLWMNNHKNLGSLNILIGLKVIIALQCHKMLITVIFECCYFLHIVKVTRVNAKSSKIRIRNYCLTNSVSIFNVKILFNQSVNLQSEFE